MKSVPKEVVDCNKCGQKHEVVGHFGEFKIVKCPLVTRPPGWEIK